MKCEACQKEEATVHLTQVINGEVRKMHLCEECAAEKGVDIQNPASIADVLLGLGQPQGERPASRAACPNCHLRPADFKKSGRLGCPACFEAFREELEPLLKSMHRTDQHFGKVPRGQSDRIKRSAESAMLQRRLEEAIAAERFEEAAELRDRLQGLRSDAATPGDSSP
jgi:protein arginine kinase activator